MRDMLLTMMDFWSTRLTSWGLDFEYLEGDKELLRCYSEDTVSFRPVILLPFLPREDGLDTSEEEMKSLYSLFSSLKFFLMELKPETDSDVVGKGNTSGLLVSS